MKSDADRVRDILAAVDRLRQRRHGAESVMIQIRLGRSAKVVRTVVRWYSGSRDVELALSGDESKAIYAALEIVQRDCDTEIKKLEAQVALIDR